MKHAARAGTVGGGDGASVDGAHTVLHSANDPAVTSANVMALADIQAVSFVSMLAFGIVQP